MISLAQLQDKGIAVETTLPPRRKALIIKSHGRKVGIASRVGRAFVLDTATDSAFNATEQVTGSDGREPKAKQAEYTRLHRRFGHIGRQILSRIHEATDYPGQAPHTAGRATSPHQQLSSILATSPPVGTVHQTKHLPSQQDRTL